MLKLFTIFSLLLCTLSVGAQKTASPVANDPAAKRILDAVSAKFKTYKSPQASFTYKIENAAGKVLSSKTGTVSMKGAKYKVSLPGMEIWSDGRTNWNYDKAAKEVTVKEVDAASGEITPQKLFTNFYDKDFLYKLNGEKKIGAVTVQEIELTPTNKNRPYHKVYLWINKATTTFHSAKILEKTGNRYSYNINAFNAAASVPDADFVFNKAKFPGVELVDLR